MAGERQQSSFSRSARGQPEYKSSQTRVRTTDDKMRRKTDRSVDRRPTSLGRSSSWFLSLSLLGPTGSAIVGIAAGRDGVVTRFVSGRLSLGPRSTRRRRRILQNDDFSHATRWEMVLLYFVADGGCC